MARFIYGVALSGECLSRHFVVVNVVNVDNEIFITFNPDLKPSEIHVPHKFKHVIQSRLSKMIFVYVFNSDQIWVSK